MDVKLMPIILERSIQQTEAEFVLHIPVALPFFKDHFTSFPVVPAVAQLLWVKDFAETLYAVGNDCDLSHLKFTRPIVPETRLKLALRYVAMIKTVEFRFFDDQHTFSSGRMLYKHV